MRLTGDTLSTLRAVCLEPLEPRRLLAFGQLDPTFGTDGRVVTAVGSSVDTPTALHDIEIAPGGAIIGGGSGGLVRWTADGAVDASFGAGGVVPAPVVYRDHAIAPDGEIYLLGSSDTDSIIVRYTAQGQADSSFGEGSLTTVSTSSLFTPAALAVQEDGKILVAGSVRSDGGKGARTRVYRLEPDGTADLAFGSGACIDVYLGVGDELTPIKKDTVAGLTVLSGGRIIIAGSSLAYSPEFYDDAAGIFNPVVYGNSVFASVRLTPNGAIDENYGDGGFSRTVYASGTLPAPASAFAHEVVNNAIGVAAYTDRLVYAQFNASGVIGFNRAADLPSFGQPLDMAAKSDGRFIVLGVPDPITGYGLQVATILEGELGNIVQTDDGRADTVDLTEAAPAGIAVAGDGNILIGGRPGDGSAAYQLAKLDDGNITDDRPDEFVGALGNDIIRDGAGGVHLAFFDVNVRVLKYAYRAPNGLWNAPVTVDAAPESGHYLSIAVDANARPGIAYFDGNFGDLKYAFSPSDGQWTTQLVEGPGSVGLYPSLQFDEAQRATVAYYKKTGGDLKLAVRHPEGHWTSEVIDGANDVGRAPSLVPQPMSGRWSIAYTDTTNSAVKFAWRTPRRAWQVETAATTVGGADFVSLAYNPFTEPAGVYQRAAISYFDAHAADVKITQSSGDADGNSPLLWTEKLLATQGLSGMYSHLTFDALHGPTVYYYNRTADRVMRLTDSVYDGITGDTLIEGAGRSLSVFSNGNTVDLAFFDENEQVLKVRSIPLRV